jgi:hypothetical protein
MKYIALTVLLAVMQATPPVPRQAADTGGSSSQPVKHNASNNETEPKTSPVVQTASPEADADKRRDIAKNDKDKPVRISELPPVSVKSGWRDTLSLILTGTLVAIGAFGICAAYRTLTAIKSQVGIMQGQLIAMQGQLTHIETSERAHLDAEFLPFGKGTVMHRLNVTNYGKSRAEVLRFSMAHVSLPKGGEWPSRLPEGSILERRRLNQMLPVGPKVPILEFDVRHYFENEEISGDRVGLLHGRVDYRDIFGKEHHTVIVYRYVQDRAELENVPAYNQYE